MNVAVAIHTLTTVDYGFPELGRTHMVSPLVSVPYFEAAYDTALGIMHF